MGEVVFSLGTGIVALLDLTDTLINKIMLIAFSVNTYNVNSADTPRITKEAQWDNLEIKITEAATHSIFFPIAPVC